MDFYLGFLVWTGGLRPSGLNGEESALDPFPLFDRSKKWWIVEYEATEDQSREWSVLPTSRRYWLCMK